MQALSHWSWSSHGWMNGVPNPCVLVNRKYIQNFKMWVPRMCCCDCVPVFVMVTCSCLAYIDSGMLETNRLIFLLLLSLWYLTIAMLVWRDVCLTLDKFHMKQKIHSVSSSCLVPLLIPSLLEHTGK
ncbi:MAG: hypothetical protein JOS17DRAFT_749373 [Linnemannia elongata]|nr:MAG: hypothetical protein JOS17DRAFT_749373 [Linnemannia elongata]